VTSSSVTTTIIPSQNIISDNNEAQATSHQSVAYLESEERVQPTLLKFKCRS